MLKQPVAANLIYSNFDIEVISHLFKYIEHLCSNIFNLPSIMHSLHSSCFLLRKYSAGYIKHKTGERTCEHDSPSSAKVKGCWADKRIIAIEYQQLARKFCVIVSVQTFKETFRTKYHRFIHETNHAAARFLF